MSIELIVLYYNVVGDYMNYTRKIKGLREEKNLTQQEIANYLNISQRTYSYYENGRNIPIEIIIKLADFYNVSVDYILGRTKNKFINK